MDKYRRMYYEDNPGRIAELLQSQNSSCQPKQLCQRNKNWKMARFSIVEFEDGIQLVPTSWIFNNNKRCYWPNYTKQEKINQSIFNEEHPDDDKWSSYDILRIFGTADTYTNGMRKLKFAEQFSDIDTSGKDDIKKKFYRRERAKKRYSSEEDSEEESCTSQKIICKQIPPSPRLQIIKEQPQTTCKIPEKKTRKQIFDNELETSNTAMIDSSLYDFNKHNMKESSSIQSDILHVGQQSPSCNTDFRTEILHKLNIILHKVNMMDKRLEVLEEQCHFILDKREGDINILQDEEMGLPLHDEFALHILEGKLKHKEFFESMVHTLKGLGGVNVHSCIINVLKKLLTNPLAEMYSLAGAKKKKAFQDLILYKIILKTTRIHYKDVTEAEVAKIVAKWLVQAKARRERKKCLHIDEDVGTLSSS